MKGSNVFVRKYLWSEKDSKNKLAEIADGLYKVVEDTPTTIVILVNDRCGKGISRLICPSTEPQWDDSG